jgi:transposase-like protein
MSSPLYATLLAANQIAKENVLSECVCPSCGERHLLIKWGFYGRYLFCGGEMIRVQRFKCLFSGSSPCDKLNRFRDDILLLVVYQ